MRAVSEIPVESRATLLADIQRGELKLFRHPQRRGRPYYVAAEAYMPPGVRPQDYAKHPEDVLGLPVSPTAA